jgi:hypothetical protein
VVSENKVLESSLPLRLEPLKELLILRLAVEKLSSAMAGWLPLKSNSAENTALNLVFFFMRSPSQGLCSGQVFWPKFYVHPNKLFLHNWGLIHHYVYAVVSDCNIREYSSLLSR